MPPSLTAFLSRRIVIFVMVVLLCGAGILSVKSCLGNRQQAEQGRQDSRSADATAKTAQDAANTVIERADKDATVDELVSETQKEIENASDEKASRRAALRAICSLPEHRDDPACELQ